MIPLELRIINFLSYRETALLNLDGIHLACITGANGAGKSTILDAMTWALFGKSRSSSDDDLVNTDAAARDETAEVWLTFELDGAVYRIIRRKRARKPMQIEFQQSADGTLDGPWRLMTEGKLRDTQNSIENLLRMNFDVFTNASFILQGGADEFTKKTPGDRKKVLSDILVLGQWETYRLAAAERRKAADTQLAIERRNIEDIDRELTEEPTRREQLRLAQERAASVRERLSAREELLSVKRRQQKEADDLGQRAVALSENLNRVRRDRDAAAKGLATHEATLAGLLAMIEGESHILADYAAWQENEQRLAVLQDQAASHNRLVNQRGPHVQTIASEQSRLAERARYLRARGDEVTQAESELAELRPRIENDRALLAKYNDEIRGYSAQAEQWSAATLQLNNLMNERRNRQREQAELAARLSRHAEFLDERQILAPIVEQLQLELNHHNDELRAMDERRAEREGLKTAIAEADAQMTHLVTLMNQKKVQMDKLRDQVASTCPECGQDLNEAHKAAVIARWHAEGTTWGDQHRALRAELAPKQGRADELDAQLRGREAVERNQRDTQNRLSHKQARLDEIDRQLSDWDAAAEQKALAEMERLLSDESEVEKLTAVIEQTQPAAARKQAAEIERERISTALARAEARLGQLEALLAGWESTERPQLVQISGQLEREEYALEARAWLAELDGQVTALGYDEAQHAAARRRREELTGADAAYVGLQTARTERKGLESTISEAAKRLTGLDEQVAEMETRHAETIAQRDILQAETADLNMLEDDVNRLREEAETAGRQLGAAEQLLSALDAQRRRREQIVVDQQEALARLRRLKTLEEAFGSKGVQAWLIDSALPDIQDRANGLLDRLTGGSMRVSLSTQKELKSGDTAETLDIRISDDMGMRPYENYSGGEKFRVNFAIRLALSQVLAHRAGASLQTLVIDEGFGTQDPEGRQRLVEAINTVKDDFRCILVITHVDELRDAFPARIEVTKAAGGSRLAVVGA